MATAAFSGVSTERGAVASESVQLGVRIGGAVRRLEIADEAARRLVEDAYAPMLCTPLGSRAHASLRRLSDGRLYVRYGRQVLRAAAEADAVPLRAAYHAVREIFSRFACEPAHSVAIYGALCAVNGGCVLLLGPTTIGKTLLALHMATGGARFLGDETVLLHLQDGECQAMARRPSLRESGLALLPEAGMAEAVRASSSHFSTERERFWYALDGAALGGIEPSAHTYPLRAVCVLNARGDAPSIKRLDTSDGLRFLAARAYVRPTSLAQLATLRRATRRAAFFDLTLGAPGESSALLLQEIARCE